MNTILLASYRCFGTSCPKKVRSAASTNHLTTAVFYILWTLEIILLFFWFTLVAETTRTYMAITPCISITNVIAMLFIGFVHHNIAVSASSTFSTEIHIASTFARGVSRRSNLKVRFACSTFELGTSWLDYISVRIDPALESILVKDDFATFRTA